MSNFVFHLLTAKGIPVTLEESENLQKKWAVIQSLRKDFDEASENQEDIVLRYLAKEKIE